MDLQQKIAYNYFFSRQSKQLLSSLGLGGIANEDLERGQDFCLRTIRHAQEKAPFEPWVAQDGDELKWIALSRMLLSSAANPFASRLFGEGIAKLCVARLRIEQDLVFLSVLSQLYPTIKQDDGKYTLGMADYINGSNELVYAPIDKGQITIEKEALLEMACKFFSTKASDLSGIDKNLLPQMVKEFSTDFAAALPVSPAIALRQFEGKFLNQACMKKILAGVGEGKRFYGSMAIAIACQKDGLSKEEASALMKQYVTSCQRSSHEFREGEALASLDWVYKHPGINLSCKKLLQQGLIDKYCDDCPQIKKAKAGEFAIGNKDGATRK
ncbi:MAG: hypothetical protein WC408_00665 [Candidatus Micrarchaeia archaeon]|jgi:hypothetical protein